MSILQHFIAGRRVAGLSGRFGSVFNPATGDTTAQVPLASASEVADTVAVAEAAFPVWAATPPLARARILFRFKALLERRADELIRLIVSEHGKVSEDARGSLTRGIEVVEFACGIPHLLKGEFSENVSGGVDSWSMRQPLGVCAGITPFNFPAMVPLWMFPLAIACGNTFILKPSEKVPSCALRLGELFQEAGLPDGVLNILGGDAEAVDALLADPGVKAVSFVGSTPVARHVYARGSAHGKRVQALGGAKNHMVVMPDADIDQAVDALMGAAYGSAGERCMAVAVAVAVGDAADTLRERLIPRVQSLHVGSGYDPASEMGPLITGAHRDRVAGYVDAGVAEGAELLVDGRGKSLSGFENGFFLGGCLFDHVRPGMRVYDDEIFGPVLCIVRTADIKGALTLVNAHPCGNGAAIFTRDGDAARMFASAAAAGMIGINVAIPVPMAFHSFGGWKQSRFGDLAIHGPEGVQFYTQIKTVTCRWPSGTAAGVHYALPTMG
jgi:malonate-semialdehyde dehydrogenase (acetylating) / methylmalonate-semialdehyde dehydrogenase